MLPAARRARDVLLDEIIRREGREFTNDPDDRGGPTKFGITLAAYQEWLGDPTATAQMLSHIEESVARSIYSEMYFEGYGFDKIVAPVAYGMLVDMSVLHHWTRSSKILQKACGVEADGFIGPMTATAANSMDPTILVVRMVGQRILFIQKIIRNDPSQAKYGVGWVKRSLDFPPFKV